MICSHTSQKISKWNINFFLKTYSWNTCNLFIRFEQKILHGFNTIAHNSHFQDNLKFWKKRVFKWFKWHVEKETRTQWWEQIGQKTKFYFSSQFQSDLSCGVSEEFCVELFGGALSDKLVSTMMLAGAELGTTSAVTFEVLELPASDGIHTAGKHFWEDKLTDGSEIWGRA